MAFPFQKSFHKWRKSFSRENYFDVQLIVLKSTGMLPIEYENYLPRSLKFLSKYLNACYVAIHYAICLFLGLCLLITVFKDPGGLDELSNYIMMGIVYLFMFFIKFYFSVKNEELKRLLAFVNTHFYVRSASGLTYITMEPGYKYASFYCTVWVLSCCLGTMHWALFPIIVQERLLPFQSWYPFNAYETPIYEIMYIIQLIGQIQTGLVYAIASGVYVSVAVLISGQFDILFCSLKNTYNTALIKSEEDMDVLKRMQLKLKFADEEVNEYNMGVEMLDDLEDMDDEDHINTGRAFSVLMPRPTVDECVADALKSSIRHHTMILKCCRMMDEFFQLYLLVILFQIISITCFLAYLLNVASDSKLVNILEYLSLVQSELLMFSYFAELLKYQSTRVGLALLRSPWYLYSPKVRKTMLIILTKAMQPVQLTAKKMYTVDAERMGVVLKTSFSFYTLLLTLRNK